MCAYVVCVCFVLCVVVCVCMFGLYVFEVFELTETGCLFIVIDNL